MELTCVLFSPCDIQRGEKISQTGVGGCVLQLFLFVSLVSWGVLLFGVDVFWFPCFLVFLLV